MWMGITSAIIFAMGFSLLEALCPKTSHEERAHPKSPVTKSKIHIIIVIAHTTTRD